MHRFGLDGMLQAYSGNCKHLQNRSPSSLHGKQHKLTKSQGVVLYFYNASLGQYKKWIICAGRHCHLTNHDCAQTWLQKPGLRGDPLFKSWAWPIGSVLLQFNCKQRSLFSDSSYGNLSDLLAGDAAILQVGTKIASNQRPFRFQTQLFNRINGQNPSRSSRSSVSTRMLLLPRSNSHLLRLDLESHRSGAFVAQIGAPTIRYRDLDPWT